MKTRFSPTLVATLATILVLVHNVSGNALSSRLAPTRTPGLAQADILEKFQRGSRKVREALNGTKQIKEQAEDIVGPGKTQQMPQASKNFPATKGSTNAPATRAGRVPAEKPTELSWPFLPDGSLFLCTFGPTYDPVGGRSSAYYKSVLWDPAIARQLFGDVHELSRPALMLLHAAHGLPVHRKWGPYSVGEAILETSEYRHAAGEFAQHDVAARLQPLFELELTRLRTITNVTSLHWCSRGQYSFTTQDYPVKGMARLWGAKSAFLDGKDDFWKPTSIPVPVDMARELDAEARGNGEVMGIVVIVKSEIVSTNHPSIAKISKLLLNEVSDGNDVDIQELPRTALVSRVKTAESLALFIPSTSKGGSPRFKRLGTLAVGP